MKNKRNSERQCKSINSQHSTADINFDDPDDIHERLAIEEACHCGSVYDSIVTFHYSVGKISKVRLVL